MRNFMRCRRKKGGGEWSDVEELLLRVAWLARPTILVRQRSVPRRSQAEEGSTSVKQEGKVGTRRQAVHFLKSLLARTATPEQHMTKKSSRSPSGAMPTTPKEKKHISAPTWVVWQKQRKMRRREKQSSPNDSHRVMMSHTNIKASAKKLIAKLPLKNTRTTCGKVRKSMVTYKKPDKLGKTKSSMEKQPGKRSGTQQPR